MLWKILMAGALGLGMAAGDFAAGPPLGDGPVREIDVQTKPVPLHRHDPNVTRIGRLKYMGGLILKSSDRQFGGLSSLLWEKECGRLLSASDTGVFAAIEPEENEDGHLQGVRAAWLSPIIDEGGAPARIKNRADAESLSLDGEDVLLWFEMVPRVQRYPGLSACRPETLRTTPTETIRIPEMLRWPSNGGAEAAANIAGKQIVIAEEQEVGKNGREGLIIDGDTKRHFIYTTPDGHVPTAMDAIDPEGKASQQLLVLNRKVSLLKGLTAIVAEITLPEEEGAIVEPGIIARFAAPYAVDNMEGLAVRTEGDRHFVYLVSDDNFFWMQRTLLLKFELLPEDLQE